MQPDEKPREIPSEETTGELRDANGRWVKGQSGNAAGRPIGSRNRAPMIVERLLDGELEELTLKLIELAKGGKVGALKFLLGRVVPPCRERTVSFEVPRIVCMDDVSEALSRVLQAVGTGQLTIEEGERLIRMLAVESQILLRSVKIDRGWV
jgi:hypothetical protein